MMGCSQAIVELDGDGQGKNIKMAKRDMWNCARGDDEIVLVQG